MGVGGDLPPPFSYCLQPRVPPLVVPVKFLILKGFPLEVSGPGPLLILKYSDEIIYNLDNGYQVL